jgi:hypothetical protein
MPFRYQRRVKLGKGLGVNLSNGGASASKRTKFGSIGTKGFSFRTGIPGLSYRGSWSKSNVGLIILILYVVVTVLWLVVYNLVRLITYGITRLYELTKRKQAD